MNDVDLAWIRARISRHRPILIKPDVAPRRAAVATIFREADDLELLFIRRARQEADPWSGHMAFPGGRMEPRDQTPLSTARRETAEEVQIDLVRSGELVGQLDDIIASARGRVLPLAITPFVFVLTEPAEAAAADRQEVEEVLWVPVRMLLDPAHSSTTPYELAGQRLHLPCFRVFGRVIWGLTYQMLMRMFKVLEWEPGA
jgi:8-oxo-dGTP pyrophosphatase MutT (NUDIX family)